MSATPDFDPKKLISALLSQGIAPDAVAKQLGVKLSDVQKLATARPGKPMPQVGNKLPKTTDIGGLFGIEIDPKQPGRHRKAPDFKWTPDKESILKSLWAQGQSSGEIAQNLGTTTDSVDKKVKRLIGSGWDGKDPTKKFSPAKPTSRPAGAGRPLPSSGSLSSQVRNVIASDGQSPARAKSFGQFAKQYVSHRAGRSLEENFGLLGAWAASKLMEEQRPGKMRESDGKSPSEPRGGKQAQVITSGVTHLGGTIARGTNMIARNISLSGEKTQTALGEIRENLKRLGGSSAPTVAARSGPTHNGPSAAVTGGLGLLGGLAGGLAIGGISKMFSGDGETGKSEKTDTDPVSRGPEADKPETKAPTGSKLDVASKTMTFKADDVEFRAGQIRFEGKGGKAGGSSSGSDPVSNPVGPADSPGGPGGLGGSENQSSGQPPTVGGPSSGPGGDQTFDQRSGDMFGGPSSPASPNPPGSVSGSAPGNGTSGVGSGGGGGGGWGDDTPPATSTPASPAVPGTSSGSAPDAGNSGGGGGGGGGGGWGDRAPASPGAPPSPAAPSPTSSTGPSAAAPGPGPVDTSQFKVIPNSRYIVATKPVVGLASERYNNPGAQWEGPNAVKYGMTGFGRLRDGNHIASFPHPVLGAASNMDLVATSKKFYLGHTIGDALGNWTNHGSHSMPGFDSKQVITKEMVNDPKFMIPFMKARADAEKGGKQKMSDAEWQQAFDIKQAGGIDNYNKQQAGKSQPPGMIETAGSALGRGISAVGNAIVPPAHAEEAPSPPSAPPSQSFKERSGDMFDTPPSTGAELNKLSEPPPAPPPDAPAAAPSTFNDRAGDMFGWSGTADKDKTPPATSKTDHAFQDQVPGINEQVNDPYVGMGS